MIRKRTLYAIILLTLLLVFFSIPLIKIYGFDWLFALDPWQHLYYTIHVEPFHYYWNTLQIADGIVSTQYPTFMRSYMHIMHLVTWIDYIELYKYFWFITRLILLILILSVIQLISRNNIIIISSAILLAWGYYFWYRSYLTFTENFILILQCSTLFSSMLFLSTQKRKFLLLMSFFVSVSFYFHPPSSIIWILIYCVTIFSYFIKNIRISAKSVFKNIWLSILTIFIIWWFSLKTIIQEYINQLLYNIWTSEWYWDLTRFIPPTLQDYYNYQSTFIIIFSLLGFLYILKYKWLKNTLYYPLIFTFIFTFILSNWPRFNLNLPVDRMQWFLLIYVGILWCCGIIFLYTRLSRYMRIFLLATLLVHSVWAVSSINSWNASKKEVKELRDYLNNYAKHEEKINFCFENVGYELVEFNFPQRIIEKCENAKKNDLIITEKKYSNLELMHKNNKYNVYLK